MAEKIKNGETYVIPETVLTIDEGAFFDTKLKNIELTEKITTIEKNAFLNSNELKELIITDNVTTIGNEIVNTSNMTIYCKTTGAIYQYCIDNGINVIIDEQAPTVEGVRFIGDYKSGTVEIIIDGADDEIVGLAKAAYSFNGGKDYQVYNVNKEKVKDNPIGFEEAKPAKGKLFLKKSAENLLKMALAVASALLEIPVVGSAVSAVAGMEANAVCDKIATVIANIKGLASNAELYKAITLPDGNLSWIGYLVHFCIDFAVHNPAIVITGGAALLGFLTSKVFYPVVKKLAEKISSFIKDKKMYKNGNTIQVNIYNLIKEILKHKNFKKAVGYEHFESILIETFNIVEKSAQYTHELYDLRDTLMTIKNLLENKKIDDYRQASINVKAILTQIQSKSYNEHREDLGAAMSK